MDKNNLVLLPALFERKHYGKGFSLQAILDDLQELYDNGFGMPLLINGQVAGFS